MRGRLQRGVLPLVGRVGCHCPCLARCTHRPTISRGQSASPPGVCMNLSPLPLLAALIKFACRPTSPGLQSLGTAQSPVICLWVGRTFVACGVDAGDVYVWEYACGTSASPSPRLLHRWPGDAPCFAIDGAQHARDVCTLVYVRAGKVYRREVVGVTVSDPTSVEVTAHGDVNAVCIPARPTNVVMAAGDDGVITAWFGEHRTKEVANVGAGVRCLHAWDGFVAAGSYDGAVRVYRVALDSADCTLLYAVPGHGGDVNSIALTYGWLASGADDGAVRLLDYRPRTDTGRSSWLRLALQVLAGGGAMGCRDVYLGIVAMHPEVAGRGQTPANTLSALLHRESRRPDATALIQAVKDSGAGTTRFVVTDKGRLAL